MTDYEWDQLFQLIKKAISLPLGSPPGDHPLSDVILDKAEDRGEDINLEKFVGRLSWIVVKDQAPTEE